METLKRILVPVMPESAQASASIPGMPSTRNILQVPLGELADIRIVKGPTAIKSEAGLLTSYVFVDFSGRDVGGTSTKPRQKRPA